MMTREAKTGLLLGLIFIIAIAIVLRGVHENSRSALDPSWTEGPSPSPALPDLAKTIESTNPAQVHYPTYDPPQETRRPTESEPAIFTNTALSRDDQARVVFEEFPDPQPPTPQQQEALKSISDAISNIFKPFTAKPPGERTIPPQPPMKTYTVVQNDNLSEIAKIMYGPDAGNTLKNIDGIFNANRKTLRSKDSLKIGQVLNIPDLPGQRLANPPSVITAPEATPKKKTPAPKTRDYVVKDGDNLWDIAAEQLGSGARVQEIARLNAKVMPDIENVRVGLRIRLPID